MPLTPVEIRHITLRRAWFRGYRKPGVDILLTPRDVELSAEERARAIERGGFFNQA